MDPFVHYGVATAMMAIQDAGLDIAADPENIGVASGAGIGGLKGIEETTIKYHEGGPRKVSPFYVTSTIINMIAGQVSIMTGHKGPNIAEDTACTTTTHNIGLAIRPLQYGESVPKIPCVDEYATTPTTVSGIRPFNTPATRNDIPGKAKITTTSGR